MRLLLFGVPLLILAITLGRSLGKDWTSFEHWIAGLGHWGPLVLFIVTALCSLALLPDTPFVMAGGALFGFGWGTMAALCGVLAGTSLCFWTARLLMRGRVRQFLDAHPRWSAIERAASREGARLQMLIRLTPIHSASFSYVMGASRVSYAAFLAGCVAMIPGLIIEAYFGYLAGHFAGVASGTRAHSLTHTVFTVIGLSMAVIVMFYVARLARRAISESDPDVELVTAE